MKILVACECSGVVRDAFIRRGHYAWSCDIKPCESPIQGRHYQCDVRKILGWNWDFMIAHPDCTFLANSGVHHLVRGGVVNQERWKNMCVAAAFFRELWDADIPQICIENPVMHGHGKKRIGIGDQTQTIQPYEYGHPESKRTCLWLKNISPLKSTKVLPLPGCGYWENQTPSGQSKLGPSPTRKTDRARTYQGIADAMAAQWSTLELAAT